MLGGLDALDAKLRDVAGRAGVTLDLDAPDLRRLGIGRRVAGQLDIGLASERLAAAPGVDDL